MGNSSMPARRPDNPQERRHAIVAATIDDDITVEELSQRFGVSLSTIRRDLQHLENAGQITRTYGGITRPRHAHELPVATKDQRFRAEKDAIARRAAEHVSPGDVCFLDAGTTVGRLAVHLRGMHPLTVVTPGINAIMALHGDRNVELIIAGGRLRHINQGLLGPLAEQCFEQVTGDKVFLGADAVHPERGISCPTMEQARLKSLMAAAALDVYVLADASKLSARPFPYWTKLPAGVRLITTIAKDGFVHDFERFGGIVEQVGLPDERGGDAVDEDTAQRALHEDRRTVREPAHSPSEGF